MLRLIAFVLPLFSPCVLAAEAPPPLKVLFLGDQGHHRPADRAAQLVPALALRGIEVAYTEDTKSLNPATLAKYDALLVYANIERIAPDQEKALLAYVTGGGGFVPVHCASYCFLNSPAYVSLVGAQFQRHGMDEFDTKVLDPAHPIMTALEPFHTRDETYVHHKHNETNRHVLQVRAEGARDEPWTWVRTEGKGRVFYTAYGHDVTTWGHPGFHDLIERGIRWAAQKGPVFDSRGHVASGLAPFNYEDAGAEIPRYLPGRNWGTQGEPIRKIQKPLEPAESRKHLALPRGFEARLFAAEPDIAKPICMAWDHRGRLWIAETYDYPNELQPPGRGRDRIKICEDSDGDGRADRFTVFAEGLSIPTSLVFAAGGVVVHQPPDTLFLRDTDGDDKADERRVLFTGWGTGDTHAGPSNLRFGLDNWLYGIVGYSGYRGTIGGEPMDFRQGLYRFKPDGSKLELLRNTSNNSWGVGLSEEGLVFGSTANGCPSVYLPIPNRYYEAVRGASPRVLRSIADSNRFFPVTDQVRQVDFHGGFTAAAGHALYTARTYPKAYWNSVAFVAEPTGHLVTTFALERRGSDFASHNLGNLLASDDEWTSPIQAEVGPDGHVWVIDWYNFIVQHNPTPRGFKTGKGAAYETPLRDKTHGRIYRVVYGAGTPSQPLRLDPSEPKTLVAGLRSNNMLWRLHAQRLLVERGKRDVVPELAALVKEATTDAIGLNTAAIHALWTLHGLGAHEGVAAEAVLEALKHPSAGVRRNALAVAPQTEPALKAVLAAGSLRDPDAQVRLAAFLALVEMPPSGEAAVAAVEALEAGAADRDAWLPDAVTMALAAHDDAFMGSVAQVRNPSPGTVQVVRRVSEHYARGGPAASISKVLIALPGAEVPIGSAVVAGLAAGWPKDLKATLGPQAEAALGALLKKLPADSRAPLVSLAARWGSDALERHSAEIAATLAATLQDNTRSDDARGDAARQLVEFRPRDPEAVRQLLAQITPRTAPDLASALVIAAGRSESPDVGPALVASLPGLSPRARDEALRALVAKADRTPALLDGVEQGTIALSALTLEQRQGLTAHPNPSLAARAKALLARGGGLPDPDRQKVIDAIARVALEGGDLSRGREVFKQQCAKCHTHNGEGGKVGPDLTGMAVHPRDELLVHILDPSRSVEGNFLQYTIATTDGRVLNGLLASETKTTVDLVDTEGKTQTLQRSEIDEMIASKKSVMPEGFEKQIPPEGFADLLAFLTRPGKYLPLDLRPVASVVSTRGMFFRPESPIERIVFPDWSPKSFEGIPFHLVDPQGDRVPNMVLLYGPNGAVPPKMPRSVSLPCHTAAKAIHLLSGISGWGAGDDSAPQSISMIVRLHYAGGSTEDHPLKNGVHFADYIRRVEVPGSKLAFILRGRQVRYLAVRPERNETIDRIELVKGPDETAPIVVAATVEVAD
jgi:putative membrane-bound dehydrogenase-like protein